MRKLPRSGSRGRRWSALRRFHGWLAIWLARRHPPLPLPTPPNAPGSLIANGGMGYISVSWSDLSTTETGFRVYRRQWSAAFGILTATGPNVTSFIDWTAELGVTYTYYVVAFNAEGASGASNQAMASVVGE